MQPRKAGGKLRKSIELIETQLAEFYRKAPPLPHRAKLWTVKWIPWGSLLGSLLTFSSVLTIWGLLHAWLPVLLLVLEAVLYLLAFPSLRLKNKTGWDYLFYAALLNILYGCSVTVTRFGNISSLVGALLSSVLALYLLYQIRGYYDKKPSKDNGR